MGSPEPRGLQLKQSEHSRSFTQPLASSPIKNNPRNAEHFDGAQGSVWLVADVQTKAKKHVLVVELPHGVLRAKVWQRR